MSILKAGRPSNNKVKLINKLAKEETVKMNININKEFHKEVKHYALSNDITVTDLILTSLRLYMKK
jgi:hypothetical protein